MKQNQKGITIVGLLITLIVIITIAGVCIYTGRDLLEEAKKTELETNILLIQAAGKNLYDKHTLDNSVELIGTNLTNDNKPDDLYLDSDKYYVLDKTNLEQLGINIAADELDETNLKSEIQSKNNVYVVNYEENTVCYLNDNFYKDYQGLEYIEGTGTQVIDTKFTVNQDTKIELDYALTTVPATSANKALIGVWTTGTNIYSIRIANNVLYYYYGSDTSHTGSTVITNTNRHKVKSDANSLYYDGEHITTRTANSFACNQTISILAQHGSSSYSRIASAKIYNCKIWDNGVLVRNFIPCYRRIDNVVGMYDLVNNEFYENAGTGTFVKGNAVTYIKY
ncbi:MAG: hypothetical protein IKT41_04370 [Clostridia bacterium]|nr:hypothetical protein [Clostridia bacterium]